MQERIYRNISWLILLLLAAGSVLVFLPAVHAPLVFDDQFTVVANPGMSAFELLMSSGGWMQVIRHLDAVFEQNIFRPVLFVSLAFNNWMGGGAPEAFHAFNLLIHALNTILVFVAVRRGFEGLRHSFRNRGPLYAAAFTAACFAVHPVQSETAIYVTARSSSLSLFFMLCAWILLERVLVRDARGEKARWTDPLRYVLAVVFALLAVLSKESAVVLPVLLFLYDRWIIAPQAAGLIEKSGAPEGQTGRPLGDSLRFAAPFLGVAAVFAGFRLFVLGKVEGVEVAPGEFSILATNLKAYWHYLWLWIVPLHLSIDHGFRYEQGFFNVRTLASGAALAAVVVWAFRRRRESPVTAFAVLGVIITLAPTTGITPLKDVFVENRMYAGTVFIGILAVQAVRYFWDVGAAKERLTVAAAALALLAVWVWRVEVRTGDWQTPVTLWESAARLGEDKSRVHYNLGVAYSYAGRDDDAFKAYVKAIELDPENYEARLNMAVLGIQQAFNLTLWDRTAVIRMDRQLQVARTELLNIAARGTKRVEAFFNLADSYRLEFQPREALYFVSQGLKADASRPELYELLGKIYEMYAIDPAVIQDYDPALWKSRDDWLTEKHRIENDYQMYSDLAFKAYSMALDLGTTNPVEVLKLQARAKLHSGDIDEAERLSYRLVNEAADDPKVHFALATILETRGRNDLAADYYRTAIQIDPSYAVAHYRLARLLERLDDYAGADAHLQIAQNFDDRYKKDYLDFQKHAADIGADMTPKFRLPR